MSGHVLVAHPFPDVYGADRVMFEVIKALRDDGHRVTVALPESGPMTAWLDAQGLPYHCVRFPVLRRALLKPVPFARLVLSAPWDLARLVRLIRRTSPDLVYVNTITLPHWIVAARLARTRTVVHSHESDTRISWVAAAVLVAPLLLSHRIIAVSRAAQGFLARSFPRLRRRTTIVYNGLSGPSGDMSTPLEQPCSRLALVGRLSPNKGQDLAIHALKAVLDAGHDVELDLVGGVFPGYEWYERDLRALTQELGLTEHVRFHGYTDDIWTVLGRSDIVLAPSRTDSLPLVVIEGMLAGRPVVAADVGGISELIDREETGRLCAPDDADDLAANITDLLHDPEQARRLGADASAAATRRFGVVRFRQEILGVVQDLIGPTESVA